MIKFLEYNIKDPNIIGLIKKYLNAGIMDKGQYVSTEEGSAQGNIISPVLANIYMHFVLVLWYKEIVQKRAKGDTFLVVYADDFISGKTFVVTGSFNNYKRSELEQIITDRGGKLSGSVSAKTSFLLTNDGDSGSSKAEKAKKLNIPIMSEDEFIKKAGL